MVRCSSRGKLYCFCFTLERLLFNISIGLSISRRNFDDLALMDVVTSINKLRAQFMQIGLERDQMKRVFKPYNPNSAMDDTEIRRLYQDSDGVDLISEMESPPISKNFMDASYMTINQARLKKMKTSKQNVSNPYNVSGYEETENTFKEEETSVNGEPSTLEMAATEVSKADTLKRNDLHSLIHVEDPQKSMKINDNTIFSAESDSDTIDSTKKVTRQSTLPFARIFKSKKESSDSLKKKSIKSAGPINQQSKNTSKQYKKNINSSTKYDVNFDFDHTLEEEEDEDEDDEDDDEEGLDLQSAFFQLDGSARVGSENGNNSNNREDKAETNNLGNVSRLKSHLPQGMIARNSILESSKNNGSAKSESLNGSSEVQPNDTKSSSLATKNQQTTNDTDDINEDISDLESYIDERDLDGISLNAAPSNMENASTYRHTSDTELQADTDFHDNDRSIAHSDSSLIDDADGLSTVSSFGKSLLESDFSTDDFIKNGYPPLSRDVSVDSTIDRNNILSHSIPLSESGYGIYHGADDSTLNNVFDKAILNIKHVKNQKQREKRSSSLSLREATHPRGSSSKRSPYNIPVISKQRRHSRASSVTIGGASKSMKKNESTSIRSKRAPSMNQGRSISEIAKSDHSSRRNSKEVLQIEKLNEIPRRKPLNSQLSSLFNRKKERSGISTDVLSYFTFVAGTKVPPYEAMDLDVYIQGSVKYKKHPFKTKVRKSAKIFEVIGFILYLYCNAYKPADFGKDGFTIEELINPNNFLLSIVDEDGEPFEDNFGKLDRKRLMQSVSDNEVVLCRAAETEKQNNQDVTPLPYDINGDIISSPRSEAIPSFATGDDKKDPTLNQLSFYKPIIKSADDLGNNNAANKTIETRVFLYPNLNPKFNYTDINVSLTSNINDILVKYCRMKNLDPNEYSLKIPDKNYVLNLNDTVLRLDGNYKVEIISKRDARQLHLEKIKPDMVKPNLPTIQSTDLTPLTLEPAISYLKAGDLEKKITTVPNGMIPTKTKRSSSKYKLGLSKQQSHSSNSSLVAGPSGGNNGFFKSKNSSKISLHKPEIVPNGNAYQDLFSGAYHRYKVWRRQQMSFISKHERTLAIDGDYIYIVPPEGRMHWHENVKTKSLHISQVILVKKSKRMPDQFKIFVKRGQDDIKRYYFEAVSVEECTEIVTRLQNLLNAYRMNHK
ncbi:Avo1p NDAI_0B02840 [Naumovozyma dairenensis CBS 421]|uniref:Uncharacterized protein n=1 Tax=Naumovozyma dairenensis (strain ATCC 10597 / BCRC 20456 / CBS 421 / NBRC 0211 / NRRL Y-12639) TaxID=1071378 RepID=G0W6A8_NAUDC|nr:hypothetical protein NDAI_0B02840 [Naumovozyma dairenensis CBS 421]CCD23319.1 hypothetical protein NDAI_0B02840 [Naumovozyma dairenensis CBS 421]